MARKIDKENIPVSFGIEAMANINGLLGPAPINLETLKADPTGYLKHVWTFLNDMELHQTGDNDRQVVDKCDKVWLMRELNELEAFKSLLRRRRRRVMKSCLRLIEQEDPEFTIRLNLDNDFIQQLTDIINNVHYSLLFLSEDTLLDRSVLLLPIARTDTLSFGSPLTNLLCVEVTPSFTLMFSSSNSARSAWTTFFRHCNLLLILFVKQNI
jgi:hypothetical protein